MQHGHQQTAKNTDSELILTQKINRRLGFSQASYTYRLMAGDKLTKNQRGLTPPPLGKKIKWGTK